MKEAKSGTVYRVHSISHSLHLSHQQVVYKSPVGVHLVGYSTGSFTNSATNSSNGFLMTHLPISVCGWWLFSLRGPGAGLGDSLARCSGPRFSWQWCGQNQAEASRAQLARQTARASARAAREAVPPVPAPRGTWKAEPEPVKVERLGAWQRVFPIFFA